MADASFNWSAEQIAMAVGGVVHGANITVTGVSTDTRTLSTGELFIALQGPNFDGHDYVAIAQQRNAAAVMVCRQLQTGLTQIIVEDTRVALGRLANAWRHQFVIPVVGVTGSNGKTTVKEMITSILACERNVLATKGNLNNDIGMPLTLLQLNATHSAAVIEMGANHAKEIDYLANIACPTVAVITNAGPAHLEGFGSLDGVAQAKGEIYTALGPDGIAVINAEDKYFDYWRSICGARKIVSFGMSEKADVRVNDERRPLTIRLPDEVISVDMKLPGRHNVLNALAASAACYAIGVKADSIRQGLQNMHAVSGRLQLKNGCNGSRIIDDTYNANPASLNAALNVLMNYPGEHLLALGDMGELGHDSERLHKEAGEQAKRSGVNRLYAVGQYARMAAQAFGENSMVFSDRNSLVSELKSCLSNESTLLVKGSRAMRMDEVVNAVISNGDN